MCAPACRGCDGGLRFALGRLQLVELARARQHFRILAGVGGRGPRLNPIGVARARRLVGVRHGGQCEPGLIALIAQLALARVERTNVGAGRRQGRPIGKLLEAERRFQPRQVCDNAAAEPDQESGKDEGHHPHEQAEQTLRYAQAFEHALLIGR